MRRKSDNEVFTEKEIIAEGEILRFDYSPETDLHIYVKTNCPNPRLSEYPYKISELHKQKSYWAVQKGTFDILECNHKLTQPENWETFSTEEAAKDYAGMNKKQFSAGEINDAIRDGVNLTSDLAGWLTHYFYQAAKSKLK